MWGGGGWWGGNIHAFSGGLSENECKYLNKRDHKFYCTFFLNSSDAETCTNVHQCAPMCSDVEICVQLHTFVHVSASVQMYIFGQIQHVYDVCKYVNNCELK